MSQGQTTSNDTESNGTKQQRPKRRWLQYSLRGLLVLTLLAAVGAWWIKRERDTARRQEQAIEELSKLGEGRFAVAYNYQFDADGKHDELADPPDDHPLLRELLGDAYFDKPEWLAINGVEVTKANSRWLRDLPSLKRVSISAYPKSERGSFAALGQLPELRELELQCDAVSDEDLLAWKNLPNLEIFVAATQGSTISSEALHAALHNKPKLRSLGLWQVNFGPGAFRDWESLPELANLDLPDCTFADQDFSGLEGTIVQQIELRGSNITDEALIHLGKLPVLNNLSLVNTAVSDAGLAHLKDLPNLEHLGLGRTRVTSEGMRHLARLPVLKTLQLTGTAVNDAGLVHLGQAKGLTYLSLTECEVTAAGLQHLAALPQLQTLILMKSPVGDADLEPLREFPALRTLSLKGTLVSDAGVSMLADLPLEELTLPDGVTSACVPDLLKMTQLKSLLLPKDFPPAAVAQVQAGLPGCRVIGGTPANAFRRRAKAAANSGN